MKRCDELFGGDKLNVCVSSRSFVLDLLLSKSLFGSQLLLVSDLDQGWDLPV